MNSEGLSGECSAVMTRVSSNDPGVFIGGTSPNTPPTAASPMCRSMLERSAGITEHRVAELSPTLAIYTMWSTMATMLHDEPPCTHVQFTEGGIFFHR